MKPPEKKRPRLPANLLRHRMKMSQIELLAAMERSPTLSAAAHAVHLTQPAASRLLNTLAEDLGIALFERDGRSLKPTAVGLMLIQRAAKFIADLDRTQTELEAMNDGLTGVVSVGTGISSSYVLVPNAIALLARAAPGIAVSVQEASMSELVARLREGRIDLFVGRFENNNATFDDILIEKLYRPSVKIVCGPRHPLAKKRKPAWKQILKEPWIFPEQGTPMRRAVESVFNKEGVRPENCLVESSAIQMNVALLNRLDLIWLLSEDVARYFASLGALHILDVPDLPAPGPFVMGQLRHHRLSPSAQRMKGCLLEVAKSPQFVTGS